MTEALTVYKLMRIVKVLLMRVVEVTLPKRMLKVTLRRRMRRVTLRRTVAKRTLRRKLAKATLFSRVCEFNLPMRVVDGQTAPTTSLPTFRGYIRRAASHDEKGKSLFPTGWDFGATTGFARWTAVRSRQP